MPKEESKPIPETATSSVPKSILQRSLSSLCLAPKYSSETRLKLESEFDRTFTVPHEEEILMRVDEMASKCQSEDYEEEFSFALSSPYCKDRFEKLVLYNGKKRFSQKALSFVAHRGFEEKMRQRSLKNEVKEGQVARALFREERYAQKVVGLECAERRKSIRWTEPSIREIDLSKEAWRRTRTHTRAYLIEKRMKKKKEYLQATNGVGLYTFRARVRNAFCPIAASKEAVAVGNDGAASFEWEKKDPQERAQKCNRPSENEEEQNPCSGRRKV